MKKSVFYFIVAAVCSLFASCAEEPYIPDFQSESASEVESFSVHFKYEVPQSLLDHFMIDAVWNNDALDDVETLPVLDPVFEVDCNPCKVKGAVVPFVLQVYRNNRPLDTLQTGDVKMTMTVTMYLKNGTVDTREFVDVIQVGLGNISTFVSNVHFRCYSIRVDKHGKMEYILPNDFL